MNLGQGSRNFSVEDQRAAGARAERGLRRSEGGRQAGGHLAEPGEATESLPRGWLAILWVGQ